MEKRIYVEDALQRQAQVDAKRSQIKYLIGTVTAIANTLLSEGDKLAEAEVQTVDRARGSVSYSAVWEKGHGTWNLDLELRDGKDRILYVRFYWNQDPKFSFDVSKGKYEFQGDTIIIYDHLQFFLDKMSKMVPGLAERFAYTLDHL